MNRLLTLLAATVLAAPAGALAEAPKPGTPEYVQRDNQNISDAYGRQTAPDGQFNNPDYIQTQAQESNDNGLRQLAQQAAAANRPAISPGNVFPGWNTGNPFRRGWAGRRGLQVPVSFTNRYGALLRGNVFAPLPGAKDPYTGAALKPPYPGVVITTGSVQGSERMYFWLAQDLAERGYVVLTYDVQGQGTSETLPHQNDQVNALPFCNPFAPPEPEEEYGCPGVPFQQPSNFVFGTLDALDFFTSTPDKPYKNPAGSDQPVNAFNPLWAQFDRSPDNRTVTPGRTTRIAIIGHSLGAFAVSYVQGIDPRVETVVALDKLTGPGKSFVGENTAKAVVPALGVQSEYGFNVSPYWMSGGSSITPQPQPPDEAPDPKREQNTGFDAWRKAGVDTMLVVPRASTHLEYTDIAYALPASRYGQDFTSYYVQAWLDRYLKHQGEPVAAKKKAVSRRRKRRARKTAAAVQPDPLLATTIKYLEPVAVGKWALVTLDRGKQLSFYYCSGWSFHDPATKRLQVNLDPGGVGGCSK
ncbi:MAG: alpha/beta hydrolase [Thermoleophilaceae bacterium]